MPGGTFSRVEAGARGSGTRVCVWPGPVPAASISPVSGPAGSPTERFTVVPADEAANPVGGAGGARVELTVIPTTLDGPLIPWALRAKTRR